MSTTEVSSRRRNGYLLLAGFLVLWASVLVAIAVTVIPDAYWYSYYSVDYSLGFVRRGLAGELVNLFPDDQYFGALRVIRWIPTIIFTLALAAVAWTVAVTDGRSERRLMLALLIPVLPFGFAFGLFSARPDLLGAAAVAVYAVAVTKSRSDRGLLVLSACFGLTLAVLTLAHEAIPPLFGLGALATLAVLAAQHSDSARRIGAALALGPGLLTAATIALLGRRGISAQICETVPHGPTNHPLAGNPTLGQLLRGFRYEVDYHDWLCRNILPLYDQTITDGIRFVGSLGVPALVASTVFGMAILALTLLSIAHVSGVPLRRFGEALRQRWMWIAVGLAMVLPVFITAVDWSRWWVVIAFDLGVVYLLFASSRPEVDEPVTRRTRVVFAVGVILLAVLPLGIIPGFGAPVPL